MKNSNDSKGRSNNNICKQRFWRTIKYEEIYLNDYKRRESIKLLFIYSLIFVISLNASKVDKFYECIAYNKIIDKKEEYISSKDVYRDGGYNIIGLRLKIFDAEIYQRNLTSKNITESKIWFKYFTARGGNYIYYSEKSNVTFVISKIKETSFKLTLSFKVGEDIEYGCVGEMNAEHCLIHI
ncbi:MAG: hypothetical protein U9N59_09970 [Campylobacterota bacterium]|nr:hypothetical protein [Campylobacterota bacterium]